LTDRRLVKMQCLIAAAATLARRPFPRTPDLWPIIYAIPTMEGQKLAREILQEMLDPSENMLLEAAAEDASHGSAARTRKILTTGEALFERQPADEGEQAVWRLEIESLARAIDASFSENTMTQDRKMLRNRIVQVLADEA